MLHDRNSGAVHAGGGRFDVPVRHQSRGRQRVILDSARQLRRRDRALRRRQVHAAADDQPPRRTLRRAHPVRRRRCHRVARQGAAAVARALGDDLPAIQPGRPARCSHQRADGAAGGNSVLALADAALAGRGQGAGDVGARTVRHGFHRRPARRPAFRRPAAARRDCARAGAGARHHSRRRADRLARSRATRGS